MSAREIDQTALTEALRTNVEEPLLDETLLARSGLVDGLSVMVTNDSGEMAITFIAKVGKRAIPVRMDFEEAGNFAQKLLMTCAAFMLSKGKR